MKRNFIIRDISRDDFSELKKHFGKNTIYKKANNHWQNYLKEHEDRNRIVKIVVINGKAIGLGTLKLKSDYPNFSKNNIPEINDILVAPEFRKQGVGKSIVESFENSAREHSFTQIGLAVGLYADYGAAQRLYIKMGYVPNGDGITYRNNTVIPGESYPVDDDLLLWLTKSLS